MGHIVLRCAGADFHLENAVAFLREAQVRFLQVALGVAAGQRPGQGQALVHLAAQQLPGGQGESAGHGVDQRHLHGALGKGVALAGLVHARQGAFKAARVLADEGRGQVVLNGVQDALGRLFVPRRAANGGGLAKARGAVFEPHLNDDRALAADGAKGELVRADRGNVQNPRLHAFNGEAALHRCVPFCGG
jgi:hypothetical protein